MTRPWYVEFFDGPYLRFFGPFVGPERTSAEVDAVERLLGLTAPVRVLDLCCGHGRHAVELARRGHDVVGVDLNQRFLDDAGAAARAAGVGVDLRCGDMRDLPVDTADVDVVVSLFNSFGYFPDDDEDAAVLREVRRVLRPDGRFLLEVEHRDGMLAAWRASEASRTADGTVVVEERFFDLRSSRKRVDHLAIAPDGARLEGWHDTRVYALTELAALGERADLRLDGWFGDLDGSVLEPESEVQVLLFGVREDA